jgi:hypothetical protein
MGSCCKCLPRPHHLHHGGTAAAPDIATLPAEAPTPVLLHGVLEITIAEMDTSRLPKFLQVWFLVSQVPKTPCVLDCGKASQLSRLEIHLRTNVKGINVIRFPP